MESSSRKGGEELSTYKKWLKLMDIKKKLADINKMKEAKELEISVW